MQLHGFWFDIIKYKAWYVVFCILPLAPVLVFHRNAGYSAPTVFGADEIRLVSDPHYNRCFSLLGALLRAIPRCFQSLSWW